MAWILWCIDPSLLNRYIDKREVEHFPLQSGTLSAADLSVLEEEMCELLARLRKQAVPLVDAFDFRDELLGSTLGAWDGRVYER